jgi:hypothetical protein
VPIIRSSLTAVAAFGLLFELGGSSAVDRGRADQPYHDQQHCYHHAPTIKPEAATAVVVAPDDGHEDARNMLSLFKRQVINLRNCCIWLVDSFKFDCLI